MSRFQTPLTTIALLAREPGLLILKSLIKNPRINLLEVWTHGTLPKAEGGGKRSEADVYRGLCDQAKIPLFQVTDGLAPCWEDGVFYDLMVSVSWRKILPKEFLQRHKHCVNIHRGALPDYPGAEPVKQALEDGESAVAITAHRMVEQVDAGEELARVWLDTKGSTDVEAIKRRLYPLYAPLCDLAIEGVVG